LEEIVAAPVKKTETNDRGDPLLPLLIREMELIKSRIDSSSYRVFTLFLGVNIVLKLVNFTITVAGIAAELVIPV
jgi:hypothetical protein